MAHVLANRDDGDGEITGVPEFQDTAFRPGHKAKWIVTFVGCAHRRAANSYLVPQVGWRIWCAGCEALREVSDSVSTRPLLDRRGKI